MGSGAEQRYNMSAIVENSYRIGSFLLHHHELSYVLIVSQPFIAVTFNYRLSPVVDGNLIPNWGSIQLDRHEFIKVPIIAGSNTGEGAAFGPTGFNATEQWYQYLTGKAGQDCIRSCTLHSLMKYLVLLDGGFDF